MSAFIYPTAESLLQEAAQSTGLHDFGDLSFKPGLEILLNRVASEARQAEPAARNLLGTIKRRLTSRLEVEDWYRVHPDVAQVKVGASVSITGLPRTGTTALTNILSLDDQFRKLRNWEQVQPCPPPILGQEDNDPRRLGALATIEAITRANPEFAAMHLSDVDATEEDVELLGMSFHAQQLTLPIFSYHAWWREADLRPAFAYHRRVVKLLQSRRPPDTWLFKAPAHNFHLDALFSAYPDTRVIMTHRDPAKAVPSAISLLSSMQSSPPANIEAFGGHHAEHLRIGVKRAMAARARIGENRFLDIHHKQFVADPFGTLEHIYAFLELNLDATTRDRMERWHAKNCSGAHGKHVYTAEQFGLSAAQIRADYAFYMDRFGIAPE